tara:strand:+ start:133 stop:930 length:798 start_codon:yes stop_codon:yes gene_type:complete
MTWTNKADCDRYWTEELPSYTNDKANVRRFTFKSLLDHADSDAKTEQKGLFDCESILFPVNVGSNSHWITVEIRPQEHVIWGYDFLRGDRTTELKAFKNWWNNLVLNENNPVLIRPNAANAPGGQIDHMTHGIDTIYQAREDKKAGTTPPRWSACWQHIEQRDGCNCGVYVCMLCRCFVERAIADEQLSDDDAFYEQTVRTTLAHDRMAGHRYDIARALLPHFVTEIGGGVEGPTHTPVNNTDKRTKPRQSGTEDDAVSFSSDER